MSYEIDTVQHTNTSPQEYQLFNNTYRPFAEDGNIVTVYIYLKRKPNNVDLHLYRSEMTLPNLNLRWQD